MSKIQVLDESTINKIAAGEVIERPSSIVKELVENALDAGATSIQVEICDGGKTYISVKDNGTGILNTDIERVFERHATSKIKSAEDLFHIKSMGFRGEAMASIAAVSEVELTTKAESEEDGTLYDIRGGIVKQNIRAGHPVGTSVIVRNLFFNTPARKKFLKSDLSEQSSIADAVERQALANPSVSVRLIIDGKTILHTPGNGDLLSVIQCIYGKNIVKSLVEVDHPSESMKITGYTSKTELSKGNSTFILCDFNGRPVKSRTVIEAVRQSYRNILMNNRYPFAILRIETNPELIDVNVHPQKHEIRVTDEKALFNTVYISIKSAINRSVMIMGASEEALGLVAENIYTSNLIGKRDKDFEKGRELLNYVSERSTVKQTVAESFEKAKIPNAFASIFTENISDKAYESSMESHKEIHTESSQKSLAESTQKNADSKANPKIDESSCKIESEESAKTADRIEPEEPCVKKEELCEIKEGPYKKIEEDRKDNGDEKVAVIFNEPEKHSAEKNYRIIGQHLNTYILIQLGEDLFMVDQHAAHERINYEYLRDSYFAQEVHIQELLMPVLIEVSPKEKPLYEMQRPLLVKFGIDMEWFGESTMAVRSVPIIMGEPLSGKVLGEIMNAIAGEKDPNERTEKILKSMACKSSVKAFDHLSQEEMEGLIQRLFACQDPYNCPHGRPVIISFSKTDLEKRFKRIV